MLLSKEQVKLTSCGLSMLASLGILLSELTSLKFCRQRSLTLIKDEAEENGKGHCQTLISIIQWVSDH